MAKKILSLILSCIILALCLSPISYASGIVPESEELNIVRALGIGDFGNPSEYMTRADFAIAVSNILSYGKTLQSKDGVFADVTSDDNFSGAVYDLYARGIVSGSSNSLFNPNAPITYEQAVKILISAMGYDIIAAYKGGYPVGYMQIAMEKEVTEDITLDYSSQLSFFDGAMLITNALEAEVLIQSSYSEDADYETRKGICLLTEYMNMKKITGIVTDNGVSSLTGKTSVSKNQLVINSAIYNADYSVYDFLGYNVNAYVTDDKNSKIVYIGYADDINVISVYSDRLLPGDSKFSVTNIVYEDINGKTKSAKVDVKADFIYNGVADLDFTTDKLRITNGNIILADNNNDGTYDVVFVNSARIFIVASVDVQNELIYDNAGGSALDVDSNKNILVTIDGKNADISLIKEDDLVTAYISRDESSINLRVSTKKLTGKIDEISTSDNGSVKINGEFYKVLDKSILDLISVGKGYEFYIDTQDNIAALKGQDVSLENVGYFVDAAMQTGLDSQLLIKVFTTGGRHSVLNCSDKLSVGSDASMSKTEARDYLKANAAGKLISYTIGADGSVKNINLPYIGADIPSDREGELQLYFQTDTKLGYSSNQKSFAGKIILSDNAVIFNIPTDESAEEDFSISEPSVLRNQSGYIFKAYTIGSQDAKADYLIRVANSTPTYEYTDAPIIIEKIVTAIDAEGEARTCIRGYNYLGEVSFFAESDSVISAASLNVGDVIRCVLNLQGRIKEVRKVLDSSSKTIVSQTDAETNYWDSCRSYVGNVYYKYGTVVGLTTSDMSVATEQQAKENMEYHNFKAAAIYIVDTNSREPVAKASIDSILDYERVGLQYSKIYMHAYESYPRMIVIYK